MARGISWSIYEIINDPCLHIYKSEILLMMILATRSIMSELFVSTYRSLKYIDHDFITLVAPHKIERMPHMQGVATHLLARSLACKGHACTDYTG